ncbi:hypothetical protein [Comamonas odontotermitis]|uniref:hypothetical protein n=1 Tax=Comamonas odontotermitis TaxID=379895 RepID=UPI0037516034
MKKSVLVKGIEIQRRIAHRRWWLRHLETRRKLARRGKGSISTLKRKAGPEKNRKNNAWFDYEAPVVMDFDANKENTLAYFDGLHSSMRERGSRIRLLFQQLRSISSEALIYLLGQIHLLQEKHGKQNLTGCYPKSRKIEHLLNESGFFGLLNIKKRKVAGKKTGSTRFITYKTGNKLQCEDIPKIRNELFGDDFEMPSHVKKEVYRALSEAMANVGEHAYANKAVSAKSLHGRWWIGASMSLRKNIFSLTFYDAGVGIPKTLPRRYNMELIRQALSVLPLIDPDDGAMIHAAVELGRTRTGKENRGKGLLDLHRLIDKINDGKLTIISRQGWYKYRPLRHQSGPMTGFLEGTLISWELPLTKSVNQLIDIEISDLELEDENNISV